MDTTDLRIGNYLRIPNLNVNIKVTAITTLVTINGEDENGKKYNSIGAGELGSAYRITLTEEWLKSFGLKRTSINGNFEFDGDELNWNYEDNEWDYEVDTSHEGDYSVIMASCKYVHQLQNLCFALTGIELTKK